MIISLLRLLYGFFMTLLLYCAVTIFLIGTFLVIRVGIMFFYEIDICELIMEYFPKRKIKKKTKKKTGLKVNDELWLVDRGRG